MHAQLGSLIRQLHEKHAKQVVVIIDEYDTPLLDCIDESRETRALVQGQLALFYGCLKDLDEHLRLVYITGILKFSNMSLFSKLNNLVDHTFSYAMATSHGYTEQEIRTNFAPHLEALASKIKVNSVNAVIKVLRNLTATVTE